jgi:hypothetical protein
MVRTRRFAFCICVLLVLTNSQTVSCSKSLDVPNNVAFTYESDPKPPRLGVNTFTVTLTSTGGERLGGAQVSLEGDMSHAGMSPVFGETRELAPGLYQGTLDLNMRGDWTVLFHIKLANGETFDRQVELRNIQAT